MITSEEDKKNEPEKKEDAEKKNLPIEKKEDIITKNIDEDDKKLLIEVKDLSNILSKDQLNLNDLKYSVANLARYMQDQQFSYLHNLLCPERAKGVKIPSIIPVPSCAFQLHNCVTLTTNSSGNIGIIFNPFFLASNDKPTFTDGESSSATLNWMSSLWVNNDNTLTGTAANTEWKPINIGQCIPTVYDQYRLVSASVIVKYIGRLDITSGVIGGGIMFEESKNLGATFTTNAANPVPTLNPDLDKYGNFDLAMDSFYHQENLTLEGMRQIYFPIDNSFEEYVKLNTVSAENFSYNGVMLTQNQDYLKSGFNFFIYTLGAPASTACLKLDIYCNFECLPNAQFLNYLPVTMSPYPISNEEKRKANAIVQQKPIMKANEVSYEIKTPNIFNKLIRKFGNSIPNVNKILSRNLITSIPGLKPGMALAGTIINQSMEED